jgi:Winged helix-turn helix
MADTVGLTMGELDRLHLMTRIAERRLTRRRAAGLLGLSERQVRRLYRAFQRDGAKALASRRRGRPSNHRLATATREHALTLVRERYRDFGPTFAPARAPSSAGGDVRNR